jgi:ankyrin repeat protein
MGNRSLTNISQSAISAAESGDILLLQKYIDNGANLKERNAKDFSAIMLAAMHNNVECLSLIIAKGYRNVINDENNSGENALTIAVRYYSKESIIVLIENGGDCYSRNKHGDSLLHIAAAQINNDCMKLLLSYNHVNIDVANEKGATPLIVTAQSSSRIDCMMSLLEAGANLESRDLYGLTPLMTAVKHGNKDGLVKLISAGANVDAKSYDGNTALLIACHLSLSTMNSCVNECIEILVIAGATIDIRNFKGLNALEMVTSSQRNDIMALLKK